MVRDTDVGHGHGLWEHNRGQTLAGRALLLNALVSDIVQTRMDCLKCACYIWRSHGCMDIGLPRDWEHPLGPAIHLCSRSHETCSFTVCMVSAQQGMKLYSGQQCGY